MSSAVKKELADRFGQRAVFDAPMAEHTSFRVGGPADALVMPADTRELIDLMCMLEQAGLPWMTLGGGTNLLVRDRGIRGVVISLRQGFGDITTHETRSDSVTVHAGAGARLSALCRYAIEQHLAGMHVVAGIPGTVGGAILMNAGTAQGTIESVLSGIDVLHVPDQKTYISREALTFAYRKLSWSEEMCGKNGYPPLVLGGWFRLQQAGKRDLAAEFEALQAKRWKTQPRGLSAGCVFQNPSADTPAGRLIDQAGFKGFRIGDAQVSEIHANFIINRDQASAADILRLMTMIREKVYQTCNVDLQPEIQIVGE